MSRPRKVPRAVTSLLRQVEEELTASSENRRDQDDLSYLLTLDGATDPFATSNPTSSINASQPWPCSRVPSTSAAFSSQLSSHDEVNPKTLKKRAMRANAPTKLKQFRADSIELAAYHLFHVRQQTLAIEAGNYDAAQPSFGGWKRLLSGDGEAQDEQLRKAAKRAFRNVLSFAGEFDESTLPDRRSSTQLTTPVKRSIDQVSPESTSPVKRPTGLVSPPSNVPCVHPKRVPFLQSVPFLASPTQAEPSTTNEPLSYWVLRDLKPGGKTELETRSKHESFSNVTPRSSQAIAAMQNDQGHLGDYLANMVDDAIRAQPGDDDVELPDVSLEGATQWPLYCTDLKGDARLAPSRNEDEDSSEDLSRLSGGVGLGEHDRHEREGEESEDTDETDAYSEEGVLRLG